MMNESHRFVLSVFPMWGVYFPGVQVAFPDYSVRPPVLMLDTGSPLIWSHTGPAEFPPNTTFSSDSFKYGSAAVTGLASSKEVVNSTVQIQQLELKAPVMFNSSVSGPGFPSDFPGVVGVDMDSELFTAFWNQKRVPTNQQYFSLAVKGLSGTGDLVVSGVPSTFNGSLGCLQMYPRSSSERVDFPAITFTNWWDTKLSALCIGKACQSSSLGKPWGIFFDSGTHGIVIPSGTFPVEEKAMRGVAKSKSCEEIKAVVESVTFQFDALDLKLTPSDLVQKITNPQTGNEECYLMVQFGETPGFFVAGTSIFSRYTMVFDWSGTVAFGLMKESPADIPDLPDNCGKEFNVVPAQAQWDNLPSLTM
jgi:hypothetical protein